MRCRCETPYSERGALLPPLVAAAEPEPRLTREHLLLQEAITKEHNEYLQKHPEIQQILNDPMVRDVINNLSQGGDQMAGQRALQDPTMRAKIEKLVASGILQMK